MASGLPEYIKSSCGKLLGTPIEAAFHMSGGDINEARRLETAKGRFFLKMNPAGHAHHIFKAESEGLQLLAQTRTLRIPQVIGHSQPNDATGFLLMEFIEPGAQRPDFWQRFGEGLAMLHRTTQANFGLDTDNFIGSLPQSNRKHNNWLEFYIEERLLPQIQLAETQHHFSTSDHENFDQLFKKLPQILPEEPPTLIHGDLWNGNFLTDEHGAPVLIDPAVCFASREMDIAMSKLFGGFDREFYQVYQEHYPFLPGWEERIDLYQLYYLLVHVNLFGGGYVQSVRQVVRGFL